MGNTKPILEVDAFLWKGDFQLPGKLILFSGYLKFRPKGFCNSHMNLEIKLKDLDPPQVFLIYDIARNGLRLKSKNGREDLFVIPELSKFLHVLKLST